MSTFATRRLLARAAIVLAATFPAACTTTTALRNPVIPKVTAKLSSTPTKPTRPQELNLSGKQPCDLIPQEVWYTFFIEKPGESRENKDFGGPECSYRTSVGVMEIHLNAANGIDSWPEVETAEKIEYTNPVEGFPALERSEILVKQRCDIVVDVADGQYLRTIATIDNPSVAMLFPKCETAHRLAEVAITTLMT